MSRVQSAWVGPVTCSDCHRAIPGDGFATEVNPPGGFGREQVLVCDDCMRSGRWDEWKREKWRNWPELPRETA